MSIYLENVSVTLTELRGDQIEHDAKNKTIRILLDNAVITIKDRPGCGDFYGLMAQSGLIGLYGVRVAISPDNVMVIPAVDEEAAEAMTNKYRNAGQERVDIISWPSTAENHRRQLEILNMT